MLRRQDNGCKWSLLLFCLALQCLKKRHQREYACAAGTRTLFRWGNSTLPVSIPQLGTQKAARWDLHLRQNAFGLLIARDPYQWEMCAEPGFMRGGDDGTALCAGAGTFAAWLTLASAFYSQWDHEICYGAHCHLSVILLLASIRSSPPVRRPSGRAGNITGTPDSWPSSCTADYRTSLAS